MSHVGAAPHYKNDENLKNEDNLKICDQEKERRTNKDELKIETSSS